MKLSDKFYLKQPANVSEKTYDRIQPGDRAAISSGSGAFLKLLISKSKKISEFRQGWIDGWREYIASLLSCCHTLDQTNVEYPLEKDKHWEHAKEDLRSSI